MSGQGYLWERGWDYGWGRIDRQEVKETMPETENFKCPEAWTCNRHIVGNCFASESEYNTCPAIKKARTNPETGEEKVVYINGFPLVRGKYVFDTDQR